MLVTNDSFINEIANNNRNYQLKIYLYKPDDTYSVVTNSNIISESFSLEDSTSKPGSFTVGAFVSTKFSFSIYGDSTDYDDVSLVRVKVNLYDSDGNAVLSDDVLICTGIVESVNYSDGYTSFSCLGKSSKFNTSFTQNNTLSGTVTLNQIVSECCRIANVEWKENTLGSMGSYSVSALPTAELSCADMVGYCCQIAGCYAKDTPNGTLTTAWYDLDGDCHSVLHTNSLTTSRNPIVITGVKVSDYKTETSSEDSQDATETSGSSSAEYGVDGYVYEVKNNPLIESGKSDTVAAHLFNNVIGGMEFYSVECSTLPDITIESGDVAKITDYKGNEFLCFVSQRRFLIGSYTNITCDAETPTTKNLGAISPIVQSLINQREKLNQEISDRQVAVADLYEKIGENTSGFYTTTEENEQGVKTAFYMHDKPQLADSKVVWKINGSAYGVTTDYQADPVVWNAVLDSSGTALLNTLIANSINVIGDNDSNHISIDSSQIYMEYKDEENSKDSALLLWESGARLYSSDGISLESDNSISLNSQERTTIISGSNLPYLNNGTVEIHGELTVNNSSTSNTNATVIHSGNIASTSANGLMTSAMVTKLNGIPSTVKSEASGGTDLSLVNTGDRYNWNHKASTSVATTSANGLMTSAMVTKLNGISTGANKTTVTSESKTATYSISGGVGKTASVTITYDNTGTLTGFSRLTPGIATVCIAGYSASKSNGVTSVTVYLVNTTSTAQSSKTVTAVANFI